MASDSRGITISTTTSAETSEGNIKGRYDSLTSYRAGFLKRGREVAKLTIPYLLPESRMNDQDFPTPYQSVGSEGVNVMASKLLMALFPPNEPFFRYMVMDESVLGNLDSPEMRQQRQDVENAVAKSEDIIMDAVESSADRESMSTGLKHLLVSGNVLLHKPDWNETTRVFPLDQYVVHRSPKGHPLEVIVKEEVSIMDLEEDVIEEAGLNKQDTYNKSSSTTVNLKTYDLYTHIHLKTSSTYEIVQELNGHTLESTRHTEPKDKCSWMALRRTKVEGESYGHGYMEEYFGDLKALDLMSKAQQEAAAIAARVIFLRNPSGTTKAKDIAEASNGDVKTGREEDVGTLKVDKMSDFQWVSVVIERLERRLSRVFLMTQAVQRSGERVTAEEIRTLVKDLEAQMGGLYSILSRELQGPYLKVIINKLSRGGKLPKWPKGIIEPVITTGLEALGRGEDLQKLQVFTQAIAQLDPEVLKTYMRMDVYINKLAHSLGIDADDLIKTQDEVMQEMAAMQQQEMKAQLLDKVGPEAVKQAGPEIKEAIKEGGI